MSITKNKVINMWLIGTFMAFVAMCAVTLVFFGYRNIKFR